MNRLTPEQGAAPQADHINWSNAPPQHDPDQTFTLKRVGAQAITGYITCNEVVGVYVHYWKGKTRPHVEGKAADGHVCEACENGNSPRWKGYLTLFDHRTREHWLQEITPAAYDGIRKGIEAHGSIHAHGIELKRSAPRANAPLKSTVWIQTLDLRLLPAAPDIRKILFRIWDIQPTSNPSTQTAEHHLAQLHVRNGHHQPENGKANP